MLVAAARVLSRCLSILALIAGIAVLFEFLQAPNTDALLVARVALLLLLSCTFLRACRLSESTIVGARAAMHLIAAGLLTNAALVFTHFATQTPLWVGSVVAAAFAEEVVFRVWLPSRLETDLAHHLSSNLSLTIAIAMAQVTFSASHVIHSGTGPSGLGPLELLRLTAAGVGLYAIVRRVGLWLAVALHAFLNLSLVLAPTAGVMPAHVEKAIWIVGSLCLASYVIARPRRRQAANLCR